MAVWTARTTFFVSTLALIIIVTGAPTFAAPQAQEEEQGAEVADPEESFLDVITVTAQKREEDARDVPLSLTTLGPEEIEVITTGGTDIRSLAAQVPSLTIESSFGRAFPRFYLRGLGNTDFDLNASQPVSMVYDEVVLENPVIKGMPIWDMERIEVLRGPQGTLFGRNTPAGIVKFDSIKPSQEKDSYLRASVGRYATTDLKGAIGGALTETLSARFSFLYQSRDDWIDNEFTGVDDALGDYSNTAYRLQFLWEPNDDFSGLLNLHGWDVDGTARIFRENIMGPSSNRLVSDFRQDKVSHDGLNSQDIQANGATIKIEYDFGATTLTSVTGFETLDMFSRGDIDGGFGSDNPFAPALPGSFPPGGPIGPIPQESETADGIPDIDQFTQEFRLSNSEDERLDWIVGVYLFNEDLSAFTNNYNSLVPGNPLAGFATQQQETDAWALFGSLNYELSDRWTVQGGLRYSDDEKNFAAERPVPVFQSPTVAPITVTTEDDFISWDLSATYEVNEEVNIFGRVATSSRAPSIQGRILFFPDFAGGTDPENDGVSVADTEDILSIEAGIKTELLEHRLRLNLTGYSWEADDQQLTIIGGAFNTAELVNADRVDGYGFEAEAELAPNSRWLATLGLSYNKSKIKDDSLTVNSCRLCTVLDPVAPNGEFSINGNSLPHAPEWSFNGIVDYRLPMGDGLFFATVDWGYSDDRSFFLYDSLEFHDNFFEVGLRVGYTFSEAKYELALYGRNITDEEILKGGIDFSNNTGFTNDPALWGVELVVNFW